MYDSKKCSKIHLILFPEKLYFFKFSPEFLPFFPSYELFKRVLVFALIIHTTNLLHYTTTLLYWHYLEVKSHSVSPLENHKSLPFFIHSNKEKLLNSGCCHTFPPTRHQCMHWPTMTIIVYIPELVLITKVGFSERGDLHIICIVCIYQICTVRSTKFCPLSNWYMVT